MLTETYQVRVLPLLQQMMPAMQEAMVLEGQAWEASAYSAENYQTVNALANFATDTTNGILHLLNAGLVWQADILLRTMTEATLKFAYIFESSNTYTERLNEYEVKWPDLDQLKAHNKAKDFIKIAPECTYFKTLILDEEEVERINHAYQNKQNWNFNDVARKLCSLKAFKGAEFLAEHVYSYGIASSLIHASFGGVSVAYERSKTPVETQDSANIHHAVEVMINVQILVHMRLFLTSSFHNLTMVPVNEWAARHEKLWNSLKVIHSQQSRK